MKSFSGGLAGSSGTGVKAPIGSSSYSNAPRVSTTGNYGVSTSAYGAPKVVNPVSKPMTSYSGGTSAGLGQNNTEMSSYQKLMADRDAKNNAPTSGLSLSGSASKKVMYGQLEQRAQTQQEEEARQQAEMQRKLAERSGSRVGSISGGTRMGSPSMSGSTKYNAAGQPTLQRATAQNNIYGQNDQLGLRSSSKGDDMLRQKSQSRQYGMGGRGQGGLGDSDDPLGDSEDGLNDRDLGNRNTMKRVGFEDQSRDPQGYNQYPQDKYGRGSIKKEDYRRDSQGNVMRDSYGNPIKLEEPRGGNDNRLSPRNKRSIDSPRGGYGDQRRDSKMGRSPQNEGRQQDDRMNNSFSKKYNEYSRDRDDDRDRDRRLSAKDRDGRSMSIGTGKYDADRGRRDDRSRSGGHNDGYRSGDSQRSGRGSHSRGDGRRKYDDYDTGKDRSRRGYSQGSGKSGYDKYDNKQRKKHWNQETGKYNYSDDSGYDSQASRRGRSKSTYFGNNRQSKHGDFSDSDRDGQKRDRDGYDQRQGRDRDDDLMRARRDGGDAKRRNTSFQRKDSEGSNDSFRARRGRDDNRDRSKGRDGYDDNKRGDDYGNRQDRGYGAQAVGADANRNDNYNDRDGRNSFRDNRDRRNTGGYQDKDNHDRNDNYGNRDKGPDDRSKDQYGNTPNNMYNNQTNNDYNNKRDDPWDKKDNYGNRDDSNNRGGYGDNKINDNNRDGLSNPDIQKSFHDDKFRKEDAPADWDRPGGSGLSTTVRSLLVRVGEYMQKNNINDLTRVLDLSTVAHGTYVVELAQLLTFLGGKAVRLDRDQAMSLAAKFLLDPAKYVRGGRNTRWVDLSALQDAITQQEYANYQGFKQGNARGAQKAKLDAHHLLRRVHDTVERYIMQTGGSIYQVFKRLDRQGVNYLDPQDLLGGLKQLGETNLNIRDVEDIMAVMDENNDGRISYAEFSNLLSQCSLTSRMDDQTHPLFPVFEALRRRLPSLEQGLAQQFGARQQQGQDGRQKWMVPWQQLLDSLKQMHIYLPRDGERELAELLDTQVNGMVDLAHFQTLVGLAEVDHKSHHQQALSHYDRQKAAPEGFQKRRDAMRGVMRKLIRRGVTAQAMRYEIQAELGPQASGREIPTRTFIELLDYSSDASKRLDQQSLQEIAELFAASRGTVDYKAFLTALESQAAMSRTATYLFGQLEAQCHQKQCQGPRELFNLQLYNTKRPDRNVRVSPYDARTLGDVMNALHLSLSQDEVKLLLVEYDPSGQARELDIEELEKDFQEYTGKDYMRNEFGQRKEMYDQFSNYWTQHGRGGGPAPQAKDLQPPPAQGAGRLRPELKDVASKCQEELQDIVEALEKRRAGPGQWLRTHSSGGRDYTRQDWSRAIAALDIRSTGRWKSSAEQIYDDVQGRERQLPTVGDFEELLGYVKTLPTRQRVSEEKTLEQVVRFFQGDDKYVNDKARNYSKQGQGPSVQEFAGFIFNESRDRCDYRLQDVEDMLQAYATHPSRRNEVDINAFMTEFTKLQRQRAIPTGRYQGGAQGPGGPQDRRQTQPAPPPPKSFVIPSAPRGNIDAAMAQIGKQLIASRQNYEEVFMKYTSPGCPPARPTISSDNVYKALSQLQINLRRDEGGALSQFLHDSRNEKTREVQLLQLLESVGLKAQTIGITAQKPLMELDQRELDQASRIMMEIQTQCEKLRKGNSIFDNAKQSREDENIAPDAFLNVIEKELGHDFAKQHRIEEALRVLTAYLSESQPSQISVRKLKLALTARRGDGPLKQAGAEENEAYKAKLRDELVNKADQGELNKLVEFLVANHRGLRDLVGNKYGERDECPISGFRDGLRNVGYHTENQLQLLAEIDRQAADFVQNSKTGMNTKQTMSLSRLKEELTRAKKKQGRPTQQSTEEKLARFEPRVRNLIEKVTKFLKQSNMTVDQLHKSLDENGDGVLEKHEFVGQMRKHHVPGLIAADLGLVFDALDINNDQQITLAEFAMFLEGAKRDKAGRVRDMDPSLVREMQEEIAALFNSFDEDGDGSITADEIYRTLLSFGMKRTPDQCRDMIREVSRNSAINREEFTKMMMPLMQEELLNQEDRVEDLRSKFLEADVDHSGFLSVDELFNMLHKMGADVSHDDVIQLMSEIDVDRDGQLDIDEFVSLLSLGDQLQLNNANSKNTYLKIQRARRMNPLDFLKCFKNMPTNFVPSFVDEKWSKERLNLPSSVFRAQVDPKTMLWKDVREVKTEDGWADSRKGYKPYLRPIESSVACQITIIEAQGVPLPQLGQGQAAFKDDHIVKRALRIAIDHDGTGRRELVHNAIQIPAQWQKQDEDIWRFNAATNPLRDALFRTTAPDGLDIGSAGLLFELVVYVKAGDDSTNITEMSCGWCELSFAELSHKRKHNLAINGGSPTAKVEISQKDLRTNRSGFKALQKTFAGGVKGGLSVEIKPLASISNDVKLHLEMMPSTCLVHLPLLTFVSGFMNYKGEKLLRESHAGGFRKPAGDVVISCFPKIYDNPDIVEELAQVWVEDVQARIANDQLNIDYIKEQTKDFISRMYPVLYSEEFKAIETQGTTRSAAGLGDTLKKRQQLIQSALRHGSNQTKRPMKEAPSDLTTFRPFSVRELDYDVWDTTRSKHDKFLAQLGNKQAQMPPIQPGRQEPQRQVRFDQQS